MKDYTSQKPYYMSLIDSHYAERSSKKELLKKIGTHATFESIFHYLVQNGYVRKNEQKHRAPYVITEKGVKLLEGLQ